MNEVTRVHENDDLWYALGNNPPSTFTPDDVADIVAEVPGANDELSWWWIIELTNGRFALVSGWCDYTGWDCQSGIYEHGNYDSALIAAESVDDTNDMGGRSIRKNLIGQITGEFPKYTYWEN